MFVFDRSALAVLVPLALLVGVVLWSRSPSAVPPQLALQAEAHAKARAADDTEGAGRATRQAGERIGDQAVAANLPSR